MAKRAAIFGSIRSGIRSVKIPASKSSASKGSRDWCNQTDRFLANLPRACEPQWRQFPKGLHMCASASFRVTSRRISCSTSVERQKEGQNNESLIGKESKNENLYCL